MARVEITYPGTILVDEFTALVEQPSVPTPTSGPNVGLVEISSPNRAGPPGPQGPPGTNLVADNPPASALTGQLWWESDTGVLYIWYDDGNSAQWVQVSTGGGSGVSNTYYVETRVYLKAFDTAVSKVVFLREDGREGIFEWTPGNFATRVAADTQEGIYVRADSVDASAGAWVRVTPGNIWEADWFGVPPNPVPDGSLPCQVQLNAMIALGNIDKPSKIQFGRGLFAITAPLTVPTWICEWAGAHGGQPTILMKFNYAEATNRGMFALNDVGGYVHDISFQAGSGSGGALFSSILTLNSPANGRLFVERCRFSGGNFVNNSVLLDGHTNTTPAGPSNRGIRFADCEVFGAAQTAFKCVSVSHAELTGMLMALSGGSGLVSLEWGGDALAYSDGNYVQGEISGPISLDWVQRSRIDTTMISGLVSNTVNVTSTIVSGPMAPGGALQHNWDNNTCCYLIGTPYFDYVTVYLGVANQTDVTGDATEQVVLFNFSNLIGNVLAGWDAALNYDTAAGNGRFTARRGGVHEINAQIALIGVLVAHTVCDVSVKVYSELNTLLQTRTYRVNPWAISAPSGRVSLPVSEKVYMAPGHYMTLSVNVSGGTKVVDIEFTSSWTHATFKLI